MPELTGSITKYPARTALFWYLVVISLGTCLLLQPVCGGSAERPISLMDAAFTATSATCVTGLGVRSTAHDFSFFGQLVIVALIQLGGIGIMTVTTYVMFQLGRRESLRRMLLSETVGADETTDLKWILRRILAITLVVEGGAFVILVLRNMFDLTVPQALWHAMFHTVSAFCNAGFALHDESLTRYREDVLVNATICALIVIGGIGFPVLLDIHRNWHGRWRDRWDRLHLHTKLTLIGTLFLLVTGAGSFLLLEWTRTLRSMSPWARATAAIFHSVSCRTAGFNTVEMSALSDAMLFLTILLMMIGAGSGSTAGGAKVSTMMVLALQAWSAFRGRTSISLFRRTIPQAVVARATATALLFAVILALAMTVMLVLEQGVADLPRTRRWGLDVAFEITSALCTVGLSTGVTPHLSTAGRAVLIVLMLVGRLGPISVFVALSRTARKQPLAYPSEEPIIG